MVELMVTRSTPVVYEQRLRGLVTVATAITSFNEISIFIVILIPQKGRRKWRDSIDLLVLK